MTESASLAAVTGGKIVTVTYEKETGPGGVPLQESVVVRAVKTSEVDKFIALQSNECELAEFLTGRKSGWADRLTHDSLFEVLAAGEEVNDPKVSALVRRRAARAPTLKAIIEPLTASISANG